MATLEAALDMFYAGDAVALERLLSTNPSLLHARVTSAEGPYCGYFHEATLLHHVAGNPLIRPLPATTTELARLILELGAEADAATRQGPAQPHDIGWSTLGLVATSDAARRAGHQRPLLELLLLLARGADIDWAALHGHTGVAALLLDRGADRTVRDTSFNATPQGWAEHAGHQAVAALVAS